MVVGAGSTSLDRPVAFLQAEKDRTMRSSVPKLRSFSLSSGLPGCSLRKGLLSSASPLFKNA
jgi:hypothetical protein